MDGGGSAFEAGSVEAALAETGTVEVALAEIGTVEIALAETGSVEVGTPAAGTMLATSPIVIAVAGPANGRRRPLGLRIWSRIVVLRSPSSRAPPIRPGLPDPACPARPRPRLRAIPEPDPDRTENRAFQQSPGKPRQRRQGPREYRVAPESR
jgi:hypothetical protein